MVSALQLVGCPTQARPLMEELMSSANDVGILAEMVLRTMVISGQPSASAEASGIDQCGDHGHHQIAPALCLKIGLQ
jgi:hypothetical protein